MIQSIYNSIKDVLYFLKKPTDQENIIQSKSQIIKILLLLLVLDILIMAPLTALIETFSKFGWVNIENHQITLLLDILPIWVVLLLTIILIPFIEEIIFRLPLRFKRNYLLKLIIYIFHGKNSTITNSIQEFWNKKYAYIFYFSALVFASIHIFNYDLKSTIIYLLPILILPQFVLSLFIGYLRVRYNFMYGYLLHAIHNAFFITITLLSINTSVSKLNIDNEIYSLNIEEVKRGENSSFNTSEDSVQFTGINLKNIIATLTDKNEYLIDFENNAFLYKDIDLKFKKKSINNLNMDSIILAYLGDLYSFKLETIQKTKKIYSLHVNDSLKLSNHSAEKFSEVSRTTNSQTKITIENVSLEVLASELSRSYKMHFEVEKSFPQKLIMELPNGDFNKLENKLKTEYGIHLKQSHKQIEYLNVKFH